MVKKCLGSFAGLLAAVGTVAAQTPTPTLQTQPGSFTPARYQQPVPVVQPPPRYQQPVPVIPPPAPVTTTPTPFVEDDFVYAPRFWASVEYLAWWVKKEQFNTQDQLNGAIVFGISPTELAGEAQLPPGSITNFADAPDRADFGALNGLRLTAGFSLDPAGEWGVEGSFFQFERGSRNFRADSPGDPVIGPVFDDTSTGQQTILRFALPDISSATLQSEVSNRLWGAEVNLRRQISALLWADRLDLIVGFRHLQYTEGLALSGSYTDLPGFIDPVAQAGSYSESFNVHNKFFGGQIGLASHSDIGPFTLDVIGKLAFGGVHQTLTINGTTTLVDAIGRGAAGQTLVSGGGILTQPTNIGRSHTGDFSVVPEVTVNLGYRVTPWMTAGVGYNFLYATNFVRAGSQIDAVDGRQIVISPAFDPAAATIATRPGVLPHQTASFWAQGINAVIQFGY